MIFDRAGCRAFRIHAFQLVYTVPRLSKLCKKQDIQQAAMTCTTLLEVQRPLFPVFRLMQEGHPAVTKEQTSGVLVMICSKLGRHHVDGGTQHQSDMTHTEDVPRQGQWSGEVQVACNRTGGLSETPWSGAA